MIFDMEVKEIRRRKLRLLVERYGGVQALADELDRTRGSIDQILNGYNLGEKGAKNIEQKLGLEPGWMSLNDFDDAKNGLAEPDSNVYKVNPSNTFRNLPLISYVQAGQWNEIVDQFQPGDADEWYFCPVKNISKHSFCLRVKGESMTNPNPNGKSYPHGTIIFVDPDRHPISGDSVVAKTTLSQEATFKVYLEDLDTIYLKPLNPTFDIYKCDKDVIIVGVVIGSFIPE